MLSLIAAASGEMLMNLFTKQYIRLVCLCNGKHCIHHLATYLALVTLCHGTIVHELAVAPQAHSLSLTKIN